MNPFCRLFTFRAALMGALLPAFLAGCGGGNLDPILGTPSFGAAPTVTATSPITSTPVVTGVAGNSVVTATFSKSMASATLTAASFSVACPTGAPVDASVAYDAATHVATLTPTVVLPPNTLCTATITNAVQDSTGIAMVANYVWGFMTAPVADTTPPTVVATVPLSDAIGVATSAPLSATFSKPMAAASLSASTFSVACLDSAPVKASVAYVAATQVATLTPAAALPAGTACTATITTAARDSTGIALAANYVWSFTTAAPPDTTPPTVILTVPVADATGVATNTRIAATFSEPMSSATLTTASFSVACPTGTPVSAAVTYDAATHVAALTPAAALPASTLCTATITTAVKDSAGNALAANYVWSFTTAALADSTRPTVILTVPAADATGVATNTAITAAFSEPMDPSTLNVASFTLRNATLATTVPGTVGYSVAASTATFTPTGATLAAGTQYTATITTTATDLAGNGLAANYVWSFTTGAVGDIVPPTVTAVTPPDGSTGICLTTAATATFSEPMDASTITIATFGVTDGGVAVVGSVSYDAASRVASFVPKALNGFAASRSFVATVKGGASGVADLAGNRLVSDKVWGFSTGTQPCLTPIPLGTAALFGAFGGAAGITNQGINTVVAGNIGSTAACTLITGFHDALNVYTQTPLNIGAVNGSVNCAPPAPGTAATLAIATVARADALTAYNAMVALPPGSDPGAGQLGGLVLAPAVYTAAGGTFGITTGDLTLDAKGDTNAVWVFQSAAALTVGLPATPRHVLLINGGQAKNVFWQVGSAARIEDGSAMVGTIIAPAGVTISTAGQTVQTTLTGRAIGLTASVTMVNTTIVAP